MVHITEGWPGEYCEATPIEEQRVSEASGQAQGRAAIKAWSWDQNTVPAGAPAHRNDERFLLGLGGEIGGQQEASGSSAPASWRYSIHAGILPAWSSSPCAYRSSAQPSFSSRSTSRTSLSNRTQHVHNWTCYHLSSPVPISIAQQMAVPPA